MLVRRTYDATRPRVGTPVSSLHWRSYYGLATELVAPHALIPHTFVGAVLDPGKIGGGVGTFSFYIAPSLACDRRILYLDIVSDTDPAPGFTVDVDGVEVGTGRARLGVASPWSVEIAVTPSETAGPLEVAIEADGVLTIRTIGLVELPAADLGAALTSMGVSAVSALAPRSPIVAASARNIRGVWSLYHALDVRRPGLAHLSVAAERPIEVTEDTKPWLAGEGPPCLPALLDVGDSVSELAVWVLARAATSSRGTVVLSTLAAGVADGAEWTETAWTWKKLAANFDCEDLAKVDGRRGSRWERPFIQLSLNGGTRMDVAAISIIRERAAGEQL